MKFKFVSFIIIILSYSNIFSQSDNIKVKYKVLASEGSLENSEMVKNSKVPELYKGIDNALITLDYELDANKTNAHFYLKEGLSLNEKATRIATIFAGRDEIYINKTDEIFIKVKNDNGEKLFISYVPLKNWSLTNESKDIEGFTCYKATIEKTVRIKKDVFKTHTVTAWYCPTIPFSFGPKEYGDLPGIILELQDNKVTYIAYKIDLNISKINNLVIDLKSKIITEGEFNEIVDSKTKDLFDKLDKYSEKK